MTTSIKLLLDRPDSGKGSGAARRRITAVTRDGEYLWLAFKKSPMLERLRWDGTAYGEHAQFDLDELIKDGAEARINVEGLAVSDGYLWISGSMALERDQPDASESNLQQLTALKTVRHVRERDRFFRCPLGPGPDGHPAPQVSLERGSKTVRCAALKVGKKGNKLLRQLRVDDHVGEFMDMPHRDNGFEISGLAAAGERVFLGLHGPVINGYAVVLELGFKVKQKGRRLKLRKVGRHGEYYRKHFLNLEGMGIHACAADLTSGHLYLLAGPAMEAPGPMAVWKMPIDLLTESPSVHHEVERRADLHAGEARSRAPSPVDVCTHQQHDLLVVYNPPASKEKGKGGQAWAERIA